MKNKIINIFNPQRLGLLLKRDAYSGYRGTLIAMGAVFGIMMLTSLLSAWVKGNPFLYQGFFPALLFVGGFIVTSLSFRELHQNGRSYLYLTLPGSHLEKFISKLLVTSVGYAAGTLLYLTVVSALCEGLNHLIFGRGNGLFNPFNREVLLAAAAYLVVQSVFIVGSTYFRKMAFLKTVLALNIITIAFGILGGVFGWILFKPYIEMARANPEYVTLLEQYFKQCDLSRIFENRIIPAGLGFFRAMQIIFWALLAPAGWLISYFRLSETEV